MVSSAIRYLFFSILLHFPCKQITTILGCINLTTWTVLYAENQWKSMKMGLKFQKWSNIRFSKRNKEKYALRIHIIKIINIIKKDGQCGGRHHTRCRKPTVSAFTRHLLRSPCIVILISLSLVFQRSTVCAPRPRLNFPGHVEYPFCYKNVVDVIESGNVRWHHLEEVLHIETGFAAISRDMLGIRADIFEYGDNVVHDDGVDLYL